MSGDLLDYSTNLGWHYISEDLYIRITDAVFQRHVEEYLRQQGIMEQTYEQRIQARQDCRRLSFWEGCTDPEVYRRVFRRIMPGPDPE